VSGYLRRIASSVLNPRASIHPIVGSFFSASIYRSATEDFKAGEDIIPTLRSPHPMTTPAEVEGTTASVHRDAITPYKTAQNLSAKPELMSSVSNMRSIKTEVTAPERSEQDRYVEVSPKAGTVFAPLVNVRQLESVAKPAAPSITMSSQAGGSRSQEGLPARKTPELVTPEPASLRSELTSLPSAKTVRHEAKENEIVGLISDELRASSRTLAAQVEQRQIKAEKPEVFPKRPHEPLKPESVRRMEPLPSVRERSTSPAHKQERADPARRLGLPPREPDEIQIHIGRIEVTAVPSAPVRPEAKPTRKSVSLDEYLKRGRR
jgi:hypothetical protein